MFEYLKIPIEDEFKSTYASGLLNIVKREAAHAKHLAKDAKDIKDLPKSKDWRAEGIISAPRAQGQCGSCWAFATGKHIKHILHNCFCLA